MGIEIRRNVFIIESPEHFKLVGEGIVVFKIFVPRLFEQIVLLVRCIIALFGLIFRLLVYFMVVILAQRVGVCR